MELEQAFRYEWLRATGVFLIGVASVIMAVTLVLLLRQNHELDQRLECRAQIRDTLDVAIARGLVAVASEDTERLQEQVEVIITVTEQIGNC